MNSWDSIFSDGSDRPLLIEIVFDEEFLGGLTLRCSPNRAYRLPTSCLLNISYGKRSEAKKEAEKYAVHMHPGMSYSAALQAPYGYGSPRHRRGDHVENTWGAYSAPYSTRSTEHVNRPPRYDKGGSPQVKIAQPAWRRREEEKRTVTSPPAERSLSPAASSQRRYVCLLQLVKCVYVYPNNKNAYFVLLQWKGHCKNI